jgi:hypothetical protein
MVVNPIYEKDPVYEEINPNYCDGDEGYMTIAPPPIKPNPVSYSGWYMQLVHASGA